MIVVDKNKMNTIYLKLYQKHNLGVNKRYIFSINDRNSGITHNMFIQDLSLNTQYYNVFNITFSSTTNYSAQTLNIENTGYYDVYVYATSDDNTNTTNKELVDKYLLYLKDDNLKYYNNISTVEVKIKTIKI
jgi:hypothetical protein